MLQNLKKHISLTVAFLLLIALIGGNLNVSAASEDIEKEKTAEKRPAYRADEIIVKYKDGISESQVRTSSEKKGLNQKKNLNLVGADVYKLKKGKNINSVLKELMKDENVEYAQPNYIYHIESVNEPYYDKLWGLNNIGQSINGQSGISDKDINAPEAWKITQGSEDVVVAVIDTGIDISHHDLADRIWTNTGEIPGDGIDNDNNGYVDDTNGWDFYENNKTVFDDEVYDEHGTHVAGTIAASLNSKGVAGVAPNVKIMPLKFIGPGGNGSTADAIEAINYAITMKDKYNIKAMVVNASWGGDSNDLALKAAIANSGLLFVAAAGNEYLNIDVTPTYPAAFTDANILTVAAVDNRGEKPDFSNYGAVSVDVGAPGVNIYSTIPGTSGTAAVMVTDAVYGNQIFVGGFGIEDFSDVVDSANPMSEDAVDLLAKVLGEKMLDIPTDAHVLVVDDDGFNGALNVAPVYTNTLNALGYTSATVHTVASESENGPDFDTLKSYDAVIWFTGRSDGTTEVKTITESDQESLSSYLEKGGKLLLFGEDALFQIENSNFVGHNLGIEVSRSNYGRNPSIAWTEETEFEGGIYHIIENNYRDHIAPLHGKAKPVLSYTAGHYTYISGTSMAAPHVSGVAALLLSKNPDLTAAEVKSIIMSYGKPLSSLGNKTVTGKMVDAFVALKNTKPPKPTGLAANKSGSNVVLNWNSIVQAGDFSHYVIQRKIGSESYAQIATTSNTTYTEMNIDTTLTYKYRIKAVDSWNNGSLYSNEVTGNAGSSSSSGGGSSGGSSSSGGGGGGGSVISPAPAVTAESGNSIDEKISEALKNNLTSSVEVAVIETNNAELASMSLKSVEDLGKANKSLVLKGSSVEMIIPPAALKTNELAPYMGSSTAKLDIKIQEVAEKEVDQMMSGVAPGMFKIGSKVFDFTAELKTEKGTTNIRKFGSKIKLSIKLNQNERNGIDVNKLGVYYFNPNSKAWEYVGGIFNPQDNTITFETDHFSKYAVMKFDKKYADIEKHWAKSEIELLSSRHIIDGTSAAEFGPDRHITRAEVAGMLVNMLRYDSNRRLELVNPEKATFKDVQESDPDFTFVETAAKAGIVTGADGYFKPNDTITREQLITMLVRAMKMDTGSDISILPFSDKAKIPGWAAKSIIAAYEKGIVMGAGGAFGVGDMTTRAQAVVMVKRIMDKMGLIQLPGKLTGKLAVNEIEGKHLELETQNGVYVLLYDMSDRLLDKTLNSMIGQNVIVTGYEVNGFTIYMRGKSFKVISAEPAK